VVPYNPSCLHLIRALAPAIIHQCLQSILHVYEPRGFEVGETLVITLQIRIDTLVKPASATQTVRVSIICNIDSAECQNPLTLCILYCGAILRKPLEYDIAVLRGSLTAKVHVGMHIKGNSENTSRVIRSILSCRLAQLWDDP